MPIKRYTAIKDNTITNAYRANLIHRGTGSNMGRADSLEVFSIYAQANSSSLEASRILVQFPVVTGDITSNTTGSVEADRNSGKIPASGSVDFYLRLFNVKHSETLSRNYTLVVSPVSQSWQEGSGLDMDEYKDFTYDGTGSNWLNSIAHTNWANDEGETLQGGSYLTASWHGAKATTYNEFNYRQTIGEAGTEDLEVKITGLVEQWIKGTGNSGYSNYGVGIFITGSEESGSRSYYTKKFSSRSSEYFFKRPVIEARWDDTRKDHRGNLYVSSSALSANDNKHTLYLYNYFRGQPKDLVGLTNNVIYVQCYTSATLGDVESVSGLGHTRNYVVTGGKTTDTGVYTASFALYTTRSVVYDRWASGWPITGSSYVAHTGSFKPKPVDTSTGYFIPSYVTNITNLRSEYNINSTARLKTFTRLKDWSPTIYKVASTEIENSFVENSFYKVFRVVDEYDVVRYGTGSFNHTRLSYDVSGSYFDLDISLLEPGYQYGIKFVYYINGVYEEQPEVFKFRVIE